MKMSFIFILFLSLFMNNNEFNNKQQRDITFLIHLLNDSKITINSIELNYAETIGNRSTDNITQFKIDIEKTFSIQMIKPDKPCCDSVRNEYYGYKQLSNDNSMQIKLVSLKNPDHPNQQKTFLLIDMFINKQPQNYINNHYTYLSNGLRQLDLNPKINTTIQGSKHAQLNHNEQMKLIKELYSKVNGKIVEGLNEEDVISLSGYSNQLSHSIKSNNNRNINLQIASRYDKLSNNTVITIGTPIITKTY